MHMSLNNITSAELRQLISIVERKERVQEELREIESKLSLHLPSEPTSPATRTRRGARKSRAVRVGRQSLEVKASNSKIQQVESKSGSKRGALKDSILGALQKADGAGIAIKDLSSALGVKAQNLHVWFSSTGRKVKGVMKVSASRWAYKGD
jgi:hypothetical protein